MSDHLRKPHPYPRAMTARELLETVGGEEHALCSVTRKGIAESGALCFWDTCGGYFTVPNNEVNRRILLNVCEQAS